MITKNKDTKKKKLTKQADKNTNIVKKTSGYKKKEEVVKAGEPPVKVRKSLGSQTIGLSLGLTRNMDNFESLRIDCWLTDELEEGETQAEGLMRLSSIIEEHLTYEVSRLTDEE